MIAPTPTCTMSPGTRWVTSTLTGVPSRVTTTSWRISECIASAARSARYSLTNPRPTDAATITPMITASIPWPTNADTSAAVSNSHNRGLRSCRMKTDQALAWWERTAFGPKMSARWDTSSVLSPDIRLPSASSTCSGAEAAAVSIDGVETGSMPLRDADRSPDATLEYCADRNTARAVLVAAWRNVAACEAIVQRRPREFA